MPWERTFLYRTQRTQRWLDQEIDTAVVGPGAQAIFLPVHKLFFQAGYLEIGYACQTELTPFLYHSFFGGEEKKVTLENQ